MYSADLGAIELVNKLTNENRCFDESDIHPLEVLTSSAALAIVNARMAAELVEHERARPEFPESLRVYREKRFGDTVVTCFEPAGG